MRWGAAACAKQTSRANDQRDFTLGSKGHSPAQVHGIAQCNYGVLAADCKSCIDEAGNEILKTCLYSKEAIMLYDSCLLQYSNWSFFGKVKDYQLRVGFCSEQNVSQPAAAAFDGARTQLLKSTTAEIIRTARMLATRELQVDGSTRLYALAKCRRDLSNFDCGKCLDGAVSKI
ncbi:cysteine-rich repeat secretory protein 38 [Morus notabilis]|uniref:cysteine-rich repeat secretory protein 38 n=1 Tax=Morus notabilis TaxID=981085 RepID=UPI000CED3595|nr:cysteine-rich repeat secretory protein 38 [Morus notabilis]